MKIRLADENGEELPGVEGFLEAIEHFELKTCLLLADCMTSMKNGSSLIKVLNLTNAPVTMHKKTEVGSYLKNKQNLFVNGNFTNRTSQKHWKIFKWENT